MSPNGKTLASGGAVWDVVKALGDRRGTFYSGPPRLRLSAQTVIGPVRALTFSPDGRLLASGGDDATINVWDVASGEMRMMLRGHAGKVLCVAFAPDGKVLASGGVQSRGPLDSRPDKMPGEVKLWDAETGEVRGTLLGHKGEVASVAFSPDGKTLASAGEDQTIRLWDPETGQERARLDGHDGFVHSLAFSPDGMTLASGSLRVKNGKVFGEIKLWHAAPWTSLAERSFAARSSVQGASISLRDEVGQRAETDQAGKAEKPTPSRVQTNTGGIHGAGQSLNGGDSKFDDSGVDDEKGKELVSATSVIVEAAYRRTALVNKKLDSDDANYVFNVGGRTVQVSNTDLGQQGKWSVVAGNEAGESEGIDTLFDGVAPGSKDIDTVGVDDNEVFFFQGASPTPVFQVDFGSTMVVTEINVFSGHVKADFSHNRRLRQNYILSGSVDGVTFTTITTVRTSPSGAYGILGTPSQHVVSITSRTGVIGEYRFLRWTGNIATGNDGTFYREIDIHGRAAEPPVDLLKENTEGATSEDSR